MQADNFEYDGRQLREYGMVICEVDSGGGVVTEDSGSNITFNKVANNSGKKYSLAGTTYEECITATFDICKDPDVYFGDDIYMSEEEYRDVFRWLNQRKFCKTRFIHECIDDGYAVYYNASFNGERILIDGNIIGIRLKMETDSPFGYHSEVFKKFSCEGSSDEKVIMDTSDVIGMTGCVISVDIMEDGDLTIIGEALPSSVVVKNCTAGETITIDSDNHMIFTSKESHKLSKDFNFAFFYLRNSYGSRKNRFTVSLKSNVTIRYTPLVMSMP